MIALEVPEARDSEAYKRKSRTLTVINVFLVAAIPSWAKLEGQLVHGTTVAGEVTSQKWLGRWSQN